MAITTIYTYPLDGSQREFIIPFEYLARRFVVLTLIGTDRKELVLTTDYRFISKTAVQTTVAWGPGDGYERIEVRRNTSATERLVDFADGSILRASELNTSQVQTMHVAEEARNMVADTIATNQDGDLDARGRRLVNLADATEAGHAVTLRQEQEWAQSTLGNRNAAEAARIAADLARDVSVTNRNQAGAFRDQAESAKTVAETARDQSVTAASTIGNNVTLAQQARSGAESARDVTVAAAQSVQGVNIPSAIGNGLKWLRQKANELGFEYVEAYTKQAMDSIVSSLSAAINSLMTTRESWVPMVPVATFTYHGPSSTLRRKHGIGMTITRPTTAQIYVAFDSPMPDAFYNVQATVSNVSGTTGAVVRDKTVNGFTLLGVLGANASPFSDECYCVIYP